MDVKKLKSFIKGATKKETFGTNPLDPWSAKANIAESASLEKYLIAKGIDPKHLTMAAKVAYAKSLDFIKWQQNHMHESIINESPSLNDYLISRGIDPKHLSMATKVSHAKSKQFIKWQQDHMHEEHDVVKKPEKLQDDKPPKGNQNSNHVHNEELGHLTNKGSGPLTADKKSEFQKAQASHKEIKTPRGPGSHNEEVQSLKTTFEEDAENEKKIEKKVDKVIKMLKKEEVESLDEISAETKKSYSDKAKAQVKELEPHAGPKGEYRDIAKNIIKRREKGIAMAKEDIEHNVGDSVTVHSGFFGKQKGEITKISKDKKRIYVKSVIDGRKYHVPYPPHKVFKEDIEQESVTYDSGWRKKTKPDTVTDKSGAKHTPMSRVKDLARKAMKKVQSEEVESLDELKKSTLASYVKGAMDNKELYTTSGSFQSGQHGDKWNKSDDYLSKYTHKKLANREKGIDTALKKLSKEETEQIDEISAETIVEENFKVGDPIMHKLDKLAGHVTKDEDERGLVRWKGPSGYFISHKSVLEKRTGTPRWRKVEEDVGDPKAAVNADGLNTQMDTMQSERKKQMSKSARIIKSIYKKKGVTENNNPWDHMEHETDPYARGLYNLNPKNPHPKGTKEHEQYDDHYRLGLSDRRSHWEEYVREDLYDHEKEDKSVATYGKKPNHDKADPKDSHGEKKPQAASVLSGGTTLTGEKRDTIEIDPMMRVRPGQPDPTKKDDKKKDDKKKDEFKKDK